MRGGAVYYQWMLYIALGARPNHVQAMDSASICMVSNFVLRVVNGEFSIHFSVREHAFEVDRFNESVVGIVGCQIGICGRLRR